MDSGLRQNDILYYFITGCHSSEGWNPEGIGRVRRIKNPPFIGMFFRFRLKRFVVDRKGFAPGHN